MVEHILIVLLLFNNLAVLTASLISGLTKAWIGTKNNGTKEISFSDHTHTASQISGLPSGVTKYSGNSFTIPGNGIYFVYVSGSTSFYISGSSGNVVVTYTINSGSNSSRVVYSSTTTSVVPMVSTGGSGVTNYNSAVILFVFNSNGYGYSPYGGYGSSMENRYNIGFSLYNPTTIKNSKYSSSYADMKVAYILF